MTAISPRIRLSWAAARVPLLVVIGLVLAVAVTLTIAFLAIRPAPAATSPAAPLPMHTTLDTCTGAHPGFPC